VMAGGIATNNVGRKSAEGWIKRSGSTAFN
jgi:hypothetical protein